jgi:hypothetical protein
MRRCASVLPHRREDALVLDAGVGVRVALGKRGEVSAAGLVRINAGDVGDLR